ncbi:hypothetical protein ACH42_08090 [Endozoicomonas sp. (ex Bugula neritina AB1)]|nr:hypothetical protein ACH42_08090 [Endozoicomonas sp. (ex Bugula neritina AB1)]
MQEACSVLFLQGPLGPFFRELAQYFSAAGYETHKINFNGGDRFYSGADQVVDYSGTPQDWPSFLQCYLLDHNIKAVFLLGDCRFYHRVAKPVCDQQGVAFMVFEEGYLRPDTITLEQSGVNALSTLDLSIERIRSTKKCSVKAPVSMGASMNRRMVYAALYYWAAFFARWRFPHYQHHRAFNPVREGACWIRGFYRKQRVKAVDHQIHNKLIGQYSEKFILVPLQVHDDSQKIFHSDYGSVEAFITEVMLSFKHYGDGDQILCFKHHPMDRGYTHYGRAIKRLARELGLQERVLYCHDNPLPELYHHAAGVVTVNSTVGISALLHKVPVKTMGKAMYDILGLTHQGSLDSFWKKPQPVDMDLFERFHSLLFQKTQINGNFFNHEQLSCENAVAFFEALFFEGQAGGVRMTHVPPVKESKISEESQPDDEVGVFTTG